MISVTFPHNGKSKNVFERKQLNVHPKSLNLSPCFNWFACISLYYNVSYRSTMFTTKMYQTGTKYKSRIMLKIYNT